MFNFNLKKCVLSSFLFVSSFLFSSIGFSYIADFRGGWHTDLSLADLPDGINITLIDVGAYREVSPGLKVGLSYTYFETDTHYDFTWHAFSPEVLYFFMKIKDRVNLYGRGGIQLLNAISDKRFDDLDISVKFPSFKVGAGAEVKIIGKLKAYGEVLLNYASIKTEYKDSIIDYSKTKTYLALLFGAGASYTLE